MKDIMKLVIDVEDLLWFVEQYNKYYKEHNGESYLDPAGLQNCLQKLVIMKGFWIDAG